MHDETSALIGVSKTLDGLVDIMESLSDTTENTDLWTAIKDAAQIAEQNVKRQKS